MRIRFLKGDPRAGSEAQMDSHRGQELIDSGAAELVPENVGHSGPTLESAMTNGPVEAPARAAALLDQNAATVVAAIGKGVDAAVLAAALVAEQAGKARKTVLEAIEAAQATE